MVLNIRRGWHDPGDIMSKKHVGIRFLATPGCIIVRGDPHLEVIRPPQKSQIGLELEY